MKKSIFIIGIFALIFVILFFGNKELFDIILGSLSDAYFQVTIFVGATFFVFYLAEKYFRWNLSQSLQKYKKYQTFLAAAIGSTPGCGGAIIIVSQYVKGNISFESVVGTLTATMGDASFLILSQKPDVGLGLIILGFLVGGISGLVVDKIHGANFLNSKLAKTKHKKTHCKNHKIPRNSFLEKIWSFLFFPSIVIALLIAFQIDLAAIFGSSGENIIAYLGAFGAVLSIGLWFFVCKKPWENSTCDFSKKSAEILYNTCFVTFWVVLAFLFYEVFVFFSEIDLSGIFSSAQMLLPLFAIFIGFIPGCGPQVLIASLYVQNIIPFSAQIGNSLSNDGDALFPAIALHPRAAILATLYSAIPAFIVAYGYMFLFEV